MKALEISGQRFGRLLVLNRVEDVSKSHTKWLCRCDCGKEKIIYGIALKRGDTNSCGCLSRELKSKQSQRFVKDLVGMRFEKLTVISRNLEYQKSINSDSAHWNCQCDCGGERIVCGSNLIRGTTKSCGCYRKERAINRNKNKALQPGESGFNEVFVHYKYNAAKKNRSFNLSKDEFRELVIGDCFYCGSIPSNVIKNATGNFVYNGVDRMDNSLGYELSNCVSCCYACNKAKMEMHSKDFMNLVKAIYEYRGKDFLNDGDGKGAANS